MHYYKRNLGDYAKKAGRLTMLQHGSYTLLIDACYDREQFPTMEQAIEWCWAATPEEICAVQFVLSRFFVLEDGVYVQERIREEITEYREKATKNQRIAQDREAKRKEPSTTRARNVNETPPNHKPLTNNHKDTPIPPIGGEVADKKPRAAFSLKTYLAECKDAGVKPIPEDDSVFDYAAQAGVSHEVLALHWAEFRARYSLPDAKKYKAWRTVFGKSVRGNWFRLWYFDQSGTCLLTTAGLQAKNLADAQRKAA